MEFNDVFCIFISLSLFQPVKLRSIDQIIEEVETNFEKNYTGPTDKFPSRVWYEYAVEGRTEELVKLQLDLIITKEHWDEIIDSEFVLPSRGKRNAVKDRSRLWPRRIPYVFNEKYDSSDKFKLLMAMDHWEEHTCLKFVEADTSKDVDLIEFVPVDFGCESLLGKMQGRQPINLAKACMYKEVIVHEIGHALGLYHEHMRHDRDDYVTVHFENINETHHRQFDKLLSQHYNGYNKPYDYESVMHYGKLFFSLNRSAELITIDPKDEAYIDVIGEAPSLSFYDVKIVNEMYKCSEGCLPKACLGDGFLGKNCQCYCQGENAYEIVLCEIAEKCDKPDVNFAQYLVFTKNYENELTSWDFEQYPHGTTFIIEHRNETCGFGLSTLNCTDGIWEGQPPPCEKACVLEDFNDDYVISNAGELIKTGFEIMSRDQIKVMCRHRGRNNDLEEEYIDCTDGQWHKKVSDIVCIKEHPLCPMVNNAQCTGTFELGFKISCLHGYDSQFQGEAVERFTCSWEGEWEPYAPVCKPDNCVIPQNRNPVGNIFGKNGQEIHGGSVIIHGNDVTLICPKGHMPDDMTFSCNYGNFSTGTIPQCTHVICPDPPVSNAVYNPKQNIYQYGDKVTVGRCPGVLMLVGSRTLNCLNDGTWSDEASCEPFCDGGEVVFEAMKNKVFKDNVRYRKHGLSSYNSCQRKCLKYNRYLCLSFVFGVEKRKRICRIYGMSADSARPDLLRYRSFWTTGVRKCRRDEHLDMN